MASRSFDCFPRLNNLRWPSARLTVVKLETS